MVQIIRQDQKRPSGEGFAEAIIGYHGQKDQAKQLAAEDKFLEENYGIKLSGVKDPKTREQIVGEHLRGQQKEDLFKKKLEYVSGLRNKNNPTEEVQEEELEGDFVEQKPKTTGKKDVERLGNQKLPYTDEEIQDMELLGEHNFAAQMQKQNEAVAREQRENLKAQADEKKEVQRQKEFAHKESKAFDESLSKSAIAAKKKNDALSNQMRLTDKLGWWDRVASVVAQNTAWGGLLKSANAQEFDSYTLPQLEGLRQLLGGVLSDSDIRLIMQKVVTADKKPEANKKIAQWLTLTNNADIAKEQIAAEIKSKNGGYRPIDYQDQINKIYMQRYGDEIKQTANEILALEDDPKVASKFRRKVSPGTKLNESSIDFYLEAAGNDSDKAMEWAIEDGYDFD